MKITQRHIEIANLVVEDNLQADKIAEKAGISRRHLDRWLNEPQFKPFQELIDELLEKRVATARKLAKCYAVGSIRRLYKLSQLSSEPETARKATNDLLQIAGLVKEPGGQSSNPIIQIFNNIPGVLAQVQAQEVKDGDTKSRL